MLRLSSGFDVLFSVRSKHLSNNGWYSMTSSLKRQDSPRSNISSIAVADEVYSSIVQVLQVSADGVLGLGPPNKLTAIIIIRA